MAIASIRSTNRLTNRSTVSLLCINRSIVYTNRSTVSFRTKMDGYCIQTVDMFILTDFNQSTGSSTKKPISFHFSPHSSFFSLILLPLSTKNPRNLISYHRSLHLGYKTSIFRLYNSYYARLGFHFAFFLSIGSIFLHLW